MTACFVQHSQGSNVTFQSRNVLSKKLIGGDGCANACPAIPMDNIDLFSIITLLSFALTLPAAVILEGVSFFFCSLSVCPYKLCVYSTGSIHPRRRRGVRGAERRRLDFGGDHSESDDRGRLFPHVPANFVHELSARLAGDAQRGQLREARRGHLIFRFILQKRGEFIFIFIWAICMTSCFVHRCPR